MLTIYLINFISFKIFTWLGKLPINENFVPDPGNSDGNLYQFMDRFLQYN